MNQTRSVSDIAYWIALHRAPGVGAVLFSELLTHFATPRQIFEQAGSTQFPRCSAATLAWLKEPDWALVERDVAWSEEADNHIITLHDPAYPALLREIGDAPPVLFVHGDPALLSMPQLAMVGSRNPTAAGRDTAFEFARHLSQSGLVITSGLASGVDGACHEGALAGGGLTVAVTGTGLDRVYPARHRDLAHRISAAGGALVSEYPPGTPPVPENFPRRNRIISGLSCGVLVVEAAKRSGSLITARLAGEQGREVFAIPGSIHNPLARGCHALIRQGAKLVESADDVLEELGALTSVTLLSADRPSEKRQVETDGAEFDADYQSLFAAMGFDPAPVDLLIQRSGLTPEAVSSMLLVLELQGYVTSAPGGVYSRVSTRVKQ